MASTITSTLELAAELEAKYSNLEILKYKAIAPLQIMLRDQNSTHAQFKHYADRLMRILAEEGLASCASVTRTITTPTGDAFTGVTPSHNVCAVSIIRAGDSLLDSVLRCDPNVAVGKILIQRDEKSADKHAVLFYSKLPPRMKTFDKVLIVDPMLATGGSILLAIKTLIDAGVDENKIIFLNVISCPEGIDILFQHYPNVKLITAGLDRGLNDQKYIVPGLGDYGDRYYDTVE